MNTYLEANAIISKFCNNYNQLKKDLPIRPSQMGVLNIIVEREGLYTPLMIADLLEVSKPMITSHLSFLEKKGYVYKQYSKEDKRSFYIIPTEKAKDLVKKTSEKMNKNLCELKSFLGEDKFNLLVNLLNESNKKLKEEL